MHKLTKRQKQILDFIRTTIDEKRYPPSVREIGAAVGLASPSTVHAHLNALEAKGYIKREGAKSRSLSIVERGDTDPVAGASSAQAKASDDTVKLPLVGNVAAGSPLLAEQNIEEEISIPKSVFGDGNSFLLKVRGDSMVDIGICDGDMVVVKEQHTARDGDIVVALLEDGATVKSFYREKDCIRLQPHNPALEPIFTRDVQILGVVTGLFRRM